MFYYGIKQDNTVTMGGVARTTGKSDQEIEREFFSAFVSHYGLQDGEGTAENFYTQAVPHIRYVSDYHFGGEYDRAKLKAEHDLALKKLEALAGEIKETIEKVKAEREAAEKLREDTIKELRRYLKKAKIEAKADELLAAFEGAKKIAGKCRGVNPFSHWGGVVLSNLRMGEPLLNERFTDD